MMEYKLTIIPVYDFQPKKKIDLEFDTAKELLAAKNSCADLLLFLQDDAKVMHDHANMFIMWRFESGEWVDYEEYELEEDVNE